MSTVTEWLVTWTREGCKVTEKVQTDPRGNQVIEIILEAEFN